MQITLIGGRNLRLPGGWTSESNLTIAGGSSVDATQGPADGHGRIKALSVVGGADIRVPPGARVKLQGGSLFGGRSVDVTPGEGPEITILACSLLGGVRVHDDGA